jgi:hypothetical protein
VWSSFGIVKNSNILDSRINNSIMKGAFRPLFQDITPEVVQAIQSDQLCLESSCLLNRNNKWEVRIVLTNTHIALADPSSSKIGYQYFTPLNYDLTF